MPYLPWKDEFSVGVTQIDEQHKHLVGLLNGLHEVMGRGGQRQEISALLHDLTAYTRFHFDYEEKLMEQANFDGLEEHRAKHRAMKAEVQRLMMAAEMGDSSALPIKLMTFLKNWLAKHIGVTDKEYTRAMHRAGIA